MSLISGIERFYASESYVTILCQKFFVSQCRKFSLGNPAVRHYFRVSKNFMLQRVMSRFSVENFLSHSAEKFRWGTLQCVTNFWYRKILCFRELCHDSLSKIFCLTVPKNFVKDPFSMSLISGIERFYASESYVTILCQKILVSQCRNFS